ncbi:tetratricopeptide repeat protein [Actinoplanes sp. NBC_00393]|uniref:tetratricopeptide repeat protein n=1 Tax=Actinoplanes sp. NBC_00393 TaxID=2975953 RepID=UPI002E21D0AF
MAALTGASVAQGRDWLEDLRHANLVQDGDGVYAMHDLLREYARRIAAPDEQTEAFNRLLDHYLDRVRAARSVRYPGRGGDPGGPPAFTDAQAARDWLDHERVNLVAAVAEAARIGDAAHACALADALWLYLHEGGHFLAATVVHRHAADVAGRTDDRLERSVALDHLGIAYQLVGDYPSGLRCLTEALDLHRAERDRQAEGRTWSHLGALEARRGNYSAAVKNLETAVAIADEVDDAIGAGNAVNRHCRCWIARSRWPSSPGTRRRWPSR